MKVITQMEIYEISFVHENPWGFTIEWAGKEYE